MVGRWGGVANAQQSVLSLKQDGQGRFAGGKEGTGEWPEPGLAFGILANGISYVLAATRWQG